MGVTTVSMEREEKLTDEQEKVCRGLSCRLRNDPEYQKMIGDIVDKRIEEKMAKVIAVAEVEMESPEFKKKVKLLKFNKDMVKKEEDDDD